MYVCMYTPPVECRMRLKSDVQGSIKSICGTEASPPKCPASPPPPQKKIVIITVYK